MPLSSEIMSAEVRSVPHLISRRLATPGAQDFARVVRGVALHDIRTLILRLATTDDPLVLWRLHLELDKRDIPPCLRWPGNQSTDQLEFVTWLADLLWLCNRDRSHVPAFRGWRDLFRHQPASAPWHALAHRQFLFVSRRYRLSHWCAKGLGLEDHQRGDLMMMPTAAMKADRRQLAPARWAVIWETLFSDALDRPDRSGVRTPERVATRRAMIWQVFVLSMRSQTEAARRWGLLTGESLSRQGLAKQVAIVEDLLRSRR